MVIVTVPAVVPLFVSIQEGIGFEVPLAGAPVIPGVEMVVHVYVVPEIEEVKLIDCVDIAEQIVWFAGLAVTIGTGLTVIR
jgi:hypothetical protein